MDCPIYHSGTSGFGRFQNRNTEGAKLEDLQIQGVLRPRKLLKGDKEPMENNSVTPHVTETLIKVISN
jgi:hypothetical protein